jgi:hypothetical protein
VLACVLFGIFFVYLLYIRVTPLFFLINYYLKNMVEEYLVLIEGRNF